MKTFDKIAAQGDFIIIRISELPEGVEQIDPTDGKHVIAHSETGHNHVMVADRVKAYRPVDGDLFRLFLAVEAPAPIEHQRSFDTHETLEVAPGIYEVRRQREYTPEGFRRAAD